MILLAALLCNYGRGFCLIDIGTEGSDTQEERLAVKFERVIVMLDGDEAGQEGTAECLTRLGRRMWVRTAILSDDRQPDQFSGHELREKLKEDGVDSVIKQLGFNMEELRLLEKDDPEAFGRRFLGPR